LGKIKAMFQTSNQYINILPYSNPSIAASRHGPWNNRSLLLLKAVLPQRILSWTQAEEPSLGDSYETWEYDSITKNK
jgi:hypothetical protein